MGDSLETRANFKLRCQTNYSAVATDFAARSGIVLLIAVIRKIKQIFLSGGLKSFNPRKLKIRGGFFSTLNRNFKEFAAKRFCILSEVADNLL
jgi:hypothetical protein